MQIKNKHFVVIKNAFLFRRGGYVHESMCSRKF